ncbi:unnamed protein product [Schistosoma curassoni]|uniref:Uncharacterized protein n=1 Tax=Schistosoma curassoni TaxID=6186 RepID=A0A183JLC8_9TREM|nr:unnamed protein product [Schistosoma curassoni]
MIRSYCFIFIWVFHIHYIDFTLLIIFNLCLVIIIV